MNPAHAERTLQSFIQSKRNRTSPAGYRMTRTRRVAPKKKSAPKRRDPLDVLRSQPILRVRAGTWVPYRKASHPESKKAINPNWDPFGEG